MESGSVGAVSVYERNGQTIARQKHPDHYNFRRSERRLGQLTRLVNVNNSWSAFGGALKGHFETRKAGQTDYNAFQSANLTNARVFLTEEDVKKYTTVLDNFFVSKGLLEPVIEVEERGEMMVSNIRVGDLELNADTTVSTLSARVVELNKGFFRPGDEIYFIRATQIGGNDSPRTPSFVVGTNLVPLSVTTSNKMRQMVSCAFEGSEALDGFVNVEGYLGCKKEENSLVAWMHRRHINDKHLTVSTQKLIGTNTLLTQYATAEARLKAIESYHPGQPNMLAYHYNPHPVINPFEVGAEAPEVTIRAESAEPDMGRVEGGGSYKVGTRLQLRALPAQGHTLLYWEDGEGSPVRDIVAVTDRVYRAHFVKI